MFQQFLLQRKNSAIEVVNEEVLLLPRITHSTKKNNITSLKKPQSSKFNKILSFNKAEQWAEKVKKWNITEWKRKHEALEFTRQGSDSEETKIILFDLDPCDDEDKPAEQEKPEDEDENCIFCDRIFFEGTHRKTMGYAYHVFDVATWRMWWCRKGEYKENMIGECSRSQFRKCQFLFLICYFLW